MNPGSDKIKGTTLLLLLVFSLPGCASRQQTTAQETVWFTSDGDSLQGVLNTPAGSGNHPLAVFVHGSGMATRNDYSEFVQPMNAAGIAVFRYDKRGVGASQGEYINVGTLNSESAFSILAGDAAAAIQHFKNDKRINSEKIILIGGSQAGWIIPEANIKTNVWLSICISGPSVTVGEEIYYSNLAEQGTMPQAQADEQLPNYSGPHGFDPRSRIAKMKQPSLWLFGGRDVSIPVRRSMAIMDSLKSTHHLPIEMKLYPDADHGIYNVQHQREDYVKFVIAWIAKRNK